MEQYCEADLKYQIIGLSYGLKEEALPAPPASSAHGPAPSASSDPGLDHPPAHPHPASPHPAPDPIPAPAL